MLRVFLQERPERAEKTLTQSRKVPNVDELRGGSSVVVTTKFTVETTIMEKKQMLAVSDDTRSYRP